MKSAYVIITTTMIKRFYIVYQYTRVGQHWM